MQSNHQTLSETIQSGTINSTESFATIYHQPSNKILMVNANFPVSDYFIKTFIGICCINKNADGQSLFSIDTTSLSTGIYVLTLIGIKNEFFETIFIKN
jgi:hypothetical protein